MRKRIYICIILCCSCFLCACGAKYTEDYPNIHKEILAEYLGEYSIGEKNKIKGVEGTLFPSSFTAYEWDITYSDVNGDKRTFKLTNNYDIKKQLGMEAINKICDEIDGLAKKNISTYDKTYGKECYEYFNAYLASKNDGLTTIYSISDNDIMYPKDVKLYNFNQNNKFVIYITLDNSTSDYEIENFTNKLIEISNYPLNINIEGHIYSELGSTSYQQRISYYRDKKFKGDKYDIMKLLE